MAYYDICAFGTRFTIDVCREGEQIFFQIESNRNCIYRFGESYFIRSVERGMC